PIYDGDFRSLRKGDDVLTIDLSRALELLSLPKGGRGRPAPLREVGKHPEDGEAIYLYSGRYGYYVKHGETTATVGKGEDFDPDAVSLEQALEALAAAPAKKNARSARAGARKAGATKKSRASKSASSKAARSEG